MATINPSTHNYTQNVTTSDENVSFLQPYDVVDYTVFIITVIVCLFGALSWIKIKKIRSLKNYVFLNTMFATVLNFFAIWFNAYKYLDTLDKGDKLFYLITLYQFVIIYLRLVVSFWLLVLCCLFYVDIVNVFKVDITRRYLKSSLFAWGVPLIITFVSSALIPITLYNIDKNNGRPDVFLIINIVLIFIPTVVNVGIYIKVLISLFKANDFSRATFEVRRVFTATLIFVLSGILFLLVPIFSLIEPSNFVLAFVEYAQIVTLDIYFLIVKSNRTVWKEYYVNSIRNSNSK
ncbi:unnamed protein product [Chrysodeixis includens]|uniref:Uncharacterized protein n=1 Tax=Chrysodeixis includens TaxID=689277 RepID=A0A9P0BY44_CHRIL|nr:unnamed protein product [Chrysodeixis includens]